MQFSLRPWKMLIMHPTTADIFGSQVEPQPTEEEESPNAADANNAQETSSQRRTWRAAEDIRAPAGAKSQKDGADNVADLMRQDSSVGSPAPTTSSSPTLSDIKSRLARLKSRGSPLRLDPATMPVAGKSSDPELSLIIERLERVKASSAAAVAQVAGDSAAITTCYSPSHDKGAHPCYSPSCRSRLAQHQQEQQQQQESVSAAENQPPPTVEHLPDATPQVEPPARSETPPQSRDAALLAAVARLDQRMNLSPSLLASPWQPPTERFEAQSARRQLHMQENDQDASTQQHETMPPLAVFMQRTVFAPLQEQINRVSLATVAYFMDDLHLKDHLTAMHRYILLQCGEFGESLTSLLFAALSTERGLASNVASTEMLRNAFALSMQDSDPLCELVSFALVSTPANPFQPDSLTALDFLTLHYKAPWPVSIVIDPSSQAKYDQIWRFLLRVKRVAWSLQNIWSRLSAEDRPRDGASFARYRQVQLFRHEMARFSTAILNYVSHEILNVSWKELETLLSNAPNLEALIKAHHTYLDSVILRSLLHPKAKPVQQILEGIFAQILTFHAQMQVTSQLWESPLAFESVRQVHKTFREYLVFLQNVTAKLIARGYQRHLRVFLMHLNYNGFYGPTDIMIETTVPDE
eukprot:m.59069 g.59069  ORF g.59069 m.59069 type:complete len:639 (-) comp13552_c1_seq1:156-2072(-)